MCTSLQTLPFTLLLLLFTTQGCNTLKCFQGISNETVADIGSLDECHPGMQFCIFARRTEGAIARGCMGRKHPVCRIAWNWTSNRQSRSGHMEGRSRLQEQL